MTVHPTGYQLADINPANGLALHFAMTWYARDQQMAQRYSRLSVLLHMFQGREDALKPEQIIELKGAKLALTEDLVNNLRSGTLAGRGFTQGHLDLKEIPAGWWSNARIDLDANTAEAQGTKIVGVLVFDAGWECAHGVQVTVQSAEAEASDRTGASGAPSSMHLINRLRKKGRTTRRAEIILCNWMMRRMIIALR